jgi:hypothetical protein
VSELRESEIEGKVTEYAEKVRKCLHLKLNVLGRVGWPDHIYLYFGPRVLFIEYKRPGEKPKKIQGYIHELIRSYGFRVAVVDDIGQGCRIIDHFTQSNSHL